jgi:hypothetical protein
MRTNLARCSIRLKNQRKGAPLKFLPRHTPHGENNHCWKGGRSDSGNGYTKIPAYGHPKTGGRYLTFEHIIVAEKALGKTLPEGVRVHHVNGIGTDNRPTNLVICQDRAYHKLIHRRARAYYACGHPDWLKCKYCKQWDDPSKMYVSPDGKTGSHRKCHSTFEKNRPGKRQKEKVAR